MGIFRPLVGGTKSLAEYQEKAQTSENDKIFTPADGLTVARPVLAAEAARILIKGESGATKVVLGMGITDAEGKVARFIDKIWPDSGWGTTAHGADWDAYADAAALLIIGPAILAAPKVSMGGKVATGIVLGQEGIKASWALKRNGEYKKLTGERLKMPSSVEGKEAMAEKLAAVVLAVATSDTENRLARTALSAGALYFAGAGAWRGEKARAGYQEVFEQMISEPVAAIEQ